MSPWSLQISCSTIMAQPVNLMNSFERTMNYWTILEVLFSSCLCDFWASWICKKKKGLQMVWFLWGSQQTKGCTVSIFNWGRAFYSVCQRYMGFTEGHNGGSLINSCCLTVRKSKPLNFSASIDIKMHLMFTLKSVKTLLSYTRLKSPVGHCETIATWFDIHNMYPDDTRCNNGYATVF